MGYVSGFPGALAQGTSLDEFAEHMREVLVVMVVEDGLPEMEAEFADIQTVTP